MPRYSIDAVLDRRQWIAGDVDLRDVGVDQNLVVPSGVLIGLFDCPAERALPTVTIVVHRVHRITQLRTQIFIRDGYSARILHRVHREQLALLEHLQS